MFCLCVNGNVGSSEASKDNLWKSAYLHQVRRQMPDDLLSGSVISGKMCLNKEFTECRMTGNQHQAVVLQGGGLQCQFLK